jgi:hypothetical protein
LEMTSFGRLRVWEPDGKEVHAVVPLEEASGPHLEERHRLRGLSIDAETMARGYAEPFDLHTTTDWLCDNS